MSYLARGRSDDEIRVPEEADRKQHLIWLGVLVFIFFVFVVVVFAWPAYRDAQITATRSDESLTLSTLEREHPAVSVEGQWKVFNDAERDAVLAAIGINVIKDSWGRRFQIAGRRLDNGTVDFIVWSPGA
jgi:hypothetical protein